MAINPLTRSSPVRIMGLSSGFDTDGLIQQMMRIHQMKIDKQFRTKTVFEWRHQTHTNIKDQINSLRNTYLTSLSPSSVLNRSLYNVVSASLSGDNKDAVTIRTGSSTPLGTLTIQRVAQLAKGASATTATAVGHASASGDGFTTSTQLGNLALAGGGGSIAFSDATIKLDNTSTANLTLAESKTTTAGSAQTWLDIKFTSGTDYTIEPDDQGDNVFVFDVNGKEVRITETDSIANFVQKFNAAAAPSDRLEFIAEVTVASEAPGGAMLSDTIQLKSTDTIAGMIDKINSNSDMNVTMSYDRLTDSFTIETKLRAGQTTRVGEALHLNGQAFEALGLITAPDGLGTQAFGGAQDAIAYIKDAPNNGLVTSTTNTFDYRGVSITLNSTTGAVIPGSGPYTIPDSEAIVVSLKSDTSSAVSNIKSAVDAVNSLLKKLDDLLRDRKGVNERGYLPLTDEEKSMMSEKQIEDWEAIAKKGIMMNDSSLQSLANTLRDEIYASIMGKKDKDGNVVVKGFMDLYPDQPELRFLGLSNGQIIVHEDRLKAALEEDPNKVADFFAGIEGGKGTGLFYRINDAVTGHVNDRSVWTMKSLENSIRQANEQMAKMQEKMWAEEERLYKMFAAMETAMSKMQQQSDWFSSMLGGGR